MVSRIDGLLALLLLALAIHSTSCGDGGGTDARISGDPEREEKAEAENEHEKRILVVGDSITAGLGLAKEEAYPARLQALIDAAGLEWNVVNAGLSGETTAGGLRRLAWLLKVEPHVVVLALGGNDGLRGIDVESTAANLQAMIDLVRETWPQARVVLAGMQAPPNMGQEFTESFRALYPRLAEENDVVLMPFLLEGVGGEPEFNQEDMMHPNAEGQQRIAEEMYEVLRPLL